MYSLPPNKSSSQVAAKAEVIISGTRSRVVSLLQPEGGGWTQFISGQYNEAVLRQYLQPQGLFQGVGEIGLYMPVIQSVTFDSPVMQTVFQVVNEKKGIVQIHPSHTVGRGRPTELAEVEPSIRKYPDAIFLFHGQPECFNVVVQLMSKYPNVYFTLDATHGYTAMKSNSFLYPDGVPASGNATAERFLADVNRIGSDRLVDEGLKNWTPLLRQYPDRIMWGTDLNDSWHFEEPVTDVVISLSRQFIGRLPADIQEKYAYQNAQRVFGRFLTPKP
jgi:predicted TIM-barrel fold metal-dependent hydrolase